MADDDFRWRWRFSPWWGYMWGPIPVSLILLIAVLASIMIYFYSQD